MFLSELTNNLAKIFRLAPVLQSNYPLNEITNIGMADRVYVLVSMFCFLCSCVGEYVLFSVFMCW